MRNGDSQIRLAEHVAAKCLDGTGLRETAILEDAFPNQHKVSRIWGETRGRATKTDRVLILGGPSAGSLPELPAIDWSSGTAVLNGASVR